MKTISFALFLTALNELTTALVRQHFYISLQLPWNQAQIYCRSNYADLSTINSQTEYDIFLIDKGSSNEDSWIGLSRYGNEWNWSDGSQYNGTINMWKNGQPDNKNTNNCVKLHNGQWEQNDCSQQKQFYCYKWISGVTLVPRQMSWENALKFCRTYYSDLASLTTPRSLLYAKNYTTTSVWTGLRFLAGSWFWVTGELLEDVTSLSKCPVEPYRCGARNPAIDLWENKDCEEKLYFLCKEKQ
ncbi:C-type mannose receptor 2-like [Xyrauchen texanus]|uniref:C-type mannose receptor 2-like n=1 Tax=Xyrauchen texanus TaxID=154827 RepID=UPI0022422AD4|nr:C-type mannose receptor 2-like [Xyrauchen texanus]